MKIEARAYLTYVETLDKLREFVIEHPDARMVAIYTFGWACGVCRAVGITLDELEGFLRTYKNDHYDKDAAT